MAKTLAELQRIAVAASPTGGQGFALPIDGALPLMLTAAAAARKVAFGTSIVAWPGAATSSTALTVTHGLAVTPAVVVVTNIANVGLNYIPVVASTTYTATTFSLTAQTVDAQTPLNTATSTFVWIAIG